MNLNAVIATALIPLLILAMPQRSVHKVTPNAEVKEHIREVIESLPEDSQMRLNLEQGMRGDGFRYPWMDQMRNEGVKRALITISFEWDGKPHKMKLARAVFYSKYDEDCAQIEDESQLRRIRETGLEKQLESVAMDRTSNARWSSWDNPTPHIHGLSWTEFTDDEWLPGGQPSFTDPDAPSKVQFPADLFYDEVAVAQFAASKGLSQSMLDSALSEAVAFSDDSCIIKPLVSAGANVNLRSHAGTTRLLVAVTEGKANVVRALLEANADPNIKNNEGKTALWIAEQGHGRYYPEVIRLLKEHGAKY